MTFSFWWVFGSTMLTVSPTQNPDGGVRKVSVRAPASSPPRGVGSFTVLVSTRAWIGLLVIANLRTSPLRATAPSATEAVTAAFAPRSSGELSGVMVTDITPAGAAAACNPGVARTPPAPSAITAPDIANLLLSI
ncbi:MAG: hypothetical protein E6I76_20875 [Chloroflexi bacterium]|nr:MAG: hypothetical protein E6I76_20875 [Chloroflexota bacterium]